MLLSLLEYFLHLDVYLVNFASAYGTWTYVILFSLIFCETGLVFTPFLPGDSLLFAAGSLAAHPESPIQIQLLTLLLMLAALLGNKTNYLIGRYVGPHWLARLINPRHLEKTHIFYEKHGGKTLILARFVPIIRTVAPFVAGVGNMSVQRFAFYNIVSAVLWVGSILGAGYFFGSLPFIQQNFSLAIYSILFLSILPILITFFYRKWIVLLKLTRKPQ